MYRKQNCIGASPARLAGDDFADGFITAHSITQGVVSPDMAVARYFDYGGAMQEVPYEPPMTSEPCPEIDCSKCPERIVYRDRIVHQPGPMQIQTQYVDRYIYVPVPGANGATPAGGFTQQELKTMYSASGGRLPTISVPDESAAEYDDYGAVVRASKPFPWWLLAVGAGAYFLAKQK